MCQLAGVSRASFYRSLQRQAPVEEDMEVRSEIQQVFAEHKRRYGYRRVNAELRRRLHRPGGNPIGPRNLELSTGNGELRHLRALNGSLREANDRYGCEHEK
jgi:hypothetical protein